MLKQRIVTAVCLVSIFLVTLLLLTPVYFGVLTAIILVAASWELGGMLGWSKPQSRWLLALFHLIAFIPFVLILAEGDSFKQGSMVALARDVLLWSVCVIWIIASSAVLMHPKAPSTWLGERSILVLGSVILLATVVSLVALRVHPDGRLWILYCVAIVAAADIGAYFSGRRWGAHKLAAAVSPGKSWEGFWGGAVCAQIIAAGFYFSLQERMLPEQGNYGLPIFMFVAFMLSTASVMGDLFESLLKRRVGLKDSSQLLPGHGGVLDRVDGLLASLPVLVVSQMVLGW